jgi:DNA-binding XRE family transcriptional regulator
LVYLSDYQLLNEAVMSKANARTLYTLRCDTNLPHEIGSWLKQLREEAGVTQATLAERLNTQKSAISRMENHAEDIRFNTLLRYLAALGKQLEIKIS